MMVVVSRVSRSMSLQVLTVVEADLDVFRSGAASPHRPLEVLVAVLGRMQPIAARGAVHGRVLGLLPRLNGGSAALGQSPSLMAASLSRTQCSRTVPDGAGRRVPGRPPAPPDPPVDQGFSDGAGFGRMVRL